MAVDDKHGRIAAGLLTAQDFDESYTDIARRIINYHKEQGRAPGKAHLDDVFDDIIGNPKHKKHKQYVFIIEGILHNSESLNPPYLISRIGEFTRRQTLKGALLEASERYQQGGPELIPDVENILFKALKFKEDDFDAGVFLNDKERGLGFLDSAPQAYLTGIPELDHVSLGPTPGQLLLFIAGKGMGKSHACVHFGKQCLLQKAKVVHISLEMPWQQVIQRYYQSFFAIPKRADDYEITKFELDTLGRLSHFKTDNIRPAVSLADDSIKTYLGQRIDDWGAKLGRLCIKDFPTSYLTIPKLEAYLDTLELTHNFIPNVLILDYPDLMNLKGDLRQSLGALFKDLRGMLKRRNLACVAPTQSNRDGWDAKTVRASMVSEDGSKVMTADMTLTYSQTDSEKAKGLARLGVAHNRGDEDKFGIIISQSYRTGQFALYSARMTSNYFDLVGGAPNGDEA